MIPIAKPYVGMAEAAAAHATILSGWLTQGRQVEAFEHEFAAYVGAPYARAVANCTAALHLALLAVGVRPGDEVITVSHSFIATANSVLISNAVPVFVDIDPATYNIDPAQIAAAVTHRTRAILCVHQMGMPCDLASVLAVAREFGLAVVEDAACAVGSEVQIDGGRWERIGRPHGDIACFSFHPRKVITTGDGGMLTTANRDWDQLFRLWRQHGMALSDTVRHEASRVIFESYPTTGFNYRMTDIQAAVGRQQLERMPEILRLRRRLADRYTQGLANLETVKVPVQPHGARSNWQSYCVRLADGCPQLDVMQALVDQGVATRRGIMCAHLEEAYADFRQTFPLPNSERARDQCVLLPLYPEMTDAEQDHVIEVLRSATRRAIPRRTAAGGGK